MECWKTGFTIKSCFNETMCNASLTCLYIVNNSLTNEKDKRGRWMAKDKDEW